MKLKTIVENLNKMPSTLKGFNETPKLTAEQKSKLMNMVGRYNEFGQKLRMENSLMETAQALGEIAELAETYACNEAQDWFATEVVKGDFKRARGISETFQKLARECYGKVQQLNALYEDMGHILERYYEIADPMQEVAPNPMDIKGQRGLPNSQPLTVVQEVKPNDKNVKSQRCLPSGGPAPAQVKEVTHNDKNIKSQRDLPSGGPAPAQVKEVAVDGMNKNIKSQRDLPSGGPTSYNPPKDPKDTGSVKENTSTVCQKCKGKGHYTTQLKDRSGKNNSSIGDTHIVSCDAPGCHNGKVDRDEYYKGWELDKLEKNKKVNEVSPPGFDKRHPDIVKKLSTQYGDKNPAKYATMWKLANKGLEEQPVNEVDHNEANLQSQRELPQGGPESFSYEKVQNPSVPVKPAGSGECNVKGERDVPQGGPAPAKYVNEVKPNTSNLQSQRELPKLGDILKTIK